MTPPVDMERLKALLPVLEDDPIEGLVKPAGYRILVEIQPPDKKRWKEAQLEMPQEMREREWQAQMYGVVMELGPEAYQDKNRFPGEGWCKKGDHILIRPYVGTRFMVRGNLYALINDDTVLGIVQGDPGEIERP